MKKINIFVVVLTAICAITQAQNRSKGGIVATATTTTSIPTLAGLGSGVEAFRFQPGLVTQSDAGTFLFGTDNRWFSLGRLQVGPPTASRSLYGFRLQKGGQGLTMGYGAPSATPNDFGNPFIEWIGNTTTTGPGTANTNPQVQAGNLEFYAASDSSTPSSRKLAFTLRSSLTALFGEVSFIPLPTLDGGRPERNPKVEINSTNIPGLIVNIAGTISGSGSETSRFVNRNNVSQTGESSAININSEGAGTVFGLKSLTGLNGNTNTGIYSEMLELSDVAVPTIQIPTKITYGIRSIVNKPQNSLSAYGIHSEVLGNPNNGSINCGVFATSTGLQSTISGPSGNYAGYFGGTVYATQGLFGSDSRLKKDIKKEISTLDKLKDLNPVSYKFIDNDKSLKLNLPTNLQHGFIAQELEKVYPELVVDLLHPQFNEKNEQIGTKTLKAINYIGLISILTGSIKEMSEKIVKLEEKLVQNEKTIIVNSTKNFTQTEIDNINTNGYFLGQNNPNPFKNATIIEYSLPVSEKNASILIFNLNGQTLKEYKLSDAKGSITIDGTVLSKGLYLYSLISDGKEIATKKMLMN